MHTLSKGVEKMTESMHTLTMGMDALVAGLRSAARRCRRSAARQGTRGRRGARSVGPFGLPWAMYRQTMAGVREVYEPAGGAQ